MKKNNVKPLALMIMGAGASLLTGCAATQKANENLAAANLDSESKFKGSSVKSSAAAMANDELNRNANFSKTTRNWIDPNPLPRVEAKVKLPEFFQKNVSMTMPGTVNAVEVLSEMQRSVNIKFNLDSDIYDTTPGQGKIVNASGGSTTNATKSSPLLISDFVYRGSLEEALNLLGAKTNLSWKWNGKEVEIYRYETKTYNIAALAGSTLTSSNVDLKGDTGGSASSGAAGATQGSAPASGSSNSNVSRKATLTTWDEVKTFLIAQLSQQGSMAVLESAGAVTIKDTPNVHKRVEKSINDLNALLSKQIYLNIDIYAVSKSDADDAGLDLNLAWGASDQFNFSSLTSSSSKAPNTFSIGILKGPWKDTKIMAKALSSIGQTSIVNQFSVTTLNGQPTPIASNRKQSYLASTKVTVQGTTGSTTTELQAGEISAGINLNVIPKIEPNGNILLEYAMNLSDIEDIVPLNSPDGTSSIQLPISNLKSVLQRASLRSGETLVLSGFKQTNAQLKKSGVGSPSNMLLGGSHNASAGSQYLVITVTPYIANSNAYNK
jgi:type IVB pilus formation R64 PilN family outer membrane protein